MSEAKNVVFAVKTAVRALSKKEYPASNRDGLANQVKSHIKSVKKHAKHLKAKA